jgi:CHAD domain-containing protein
MNREEIGEFLFRFYRKRTTSFLANIYKASVTGETKDIHRARLDVKRIFALYNLFEMLDPHAFKKRGGYKLFRPLYRQAGKIREIQVNYLLLANLPVPGEDFSPFVKWLRADELRTVEKFLRLVKNFREPELEATDRVVQKLCRSSSIYKLRSKTLALIKEKAIEIRELQQGEPGDKGIHKIRQKLKTMSTIATLVYSIKAGQKLDQIISLLNKTEMMIGDWHDRVVLRESIDRFLEQKTVGSKEELASMELLRQNLLEYNLNLVQHFIPEVERIVQTICEEEN